MSMEVKKEPGEEWLHRYLDEYFTLEEPAKLAECITGEAVRQRLRSRGLKLRGRAETLRLRELREVSSRGTKSERCSSNVEVTH